MVLGNKINFVRSTSPKYSSRCHKYYCTVFFSSISISVTIHIQQTLPNKHGIATVSYVLWSDNKVDILGLVGCVENLQDLSF